MKRILILTAAMLYLATSAFALDSLVIDSNFSSSGKSLRGTSAAATTTGEGEAAVTTDAVTADSPLIGKLSTGVGVGMLIDSVAGSGYSLVTQHKAGSKAFGSAYDSTAIFTTVNELNPGEVYLDVPTAIDETAFSGDAWRKM